MNIIGCKYVWSLATPPKLAKSKLVKSTLSGAAASLELFMKCNDKRDLCNFEELNSSEPDIKLFDSGEAILGYILLKDSEQVARIYSSKAPYRAESKEDAKKKVVEGVHLAKQQCKGDTYKIKENEEASLYF